MANKRSPFVAKHGVVSKGPIDLGTNTLTVSSISGDPYTLFTDGLSGHLSGSLAGFADLIEGSIGITPSTDDDSAKLATTKFVQEVITGTGQLTPALCARWEGTYTTVNVESGDWETAFTKSVANEADITNIAGTSSLWDSAYTTLYTTSGIWGDASQGQSAYSTVQSKSGQWDAADSATETIRGASGNWNSTYTTVGGFSGSWDTTYTTTNEYSGGWQSTYNQVQDGTTDLNVDTGTLFVDKSENRVGIGTTTPNELFTVAGNMSAQGVLYANQSGVIGDSTQWFSTYTTVHDTSSQWDDAYTDSQLNKGDITNIAGTSADWDSAYTSVNDTSALWDTTYTTVGGFSGKWGQLEADITEVANTSAFWDSTYTTVGEYSGGWQTTKGTVDASSTSWDTAYTDSQSNKDDITNVANASGGWDAAIDDITNIAGTSALWDTTYTTTNQYSGGWETTKSTVDGGNSQWDIAYTDSQANKADITKIANTSAFWDTTYTTVNEYSGFWSTTYEDVTRQIDEWNSTWSTLTANSGEWEAAYEKIITQQDEWDNTWNTLTATSANWNTAYTKSLANEADITEVANTSALWDTTYTTTNEYSGGWQSTKATVDTGNAIWDTTYTTTNEYSGGWETTKATVDTGNALWDTTYTTVGEYSGKWAANEDDVTNLANTSGDWDSVYTSARGSSALWDTTYTTVGEFSAAWGTNEDDITNLANASGDWDSAYTSVNDTSALWDTTYTTTNEYSGGWESTKATVDTGNALWDTTYTTTNEYSGGWESTKATVDTGNALWDAAIDDITEIANTSADWVSTHTTLNAQSGDFWEGTYTTVHTESGNWGSTAVGGGWTDGGDFIYVSNTGDTVSIGTTDELASKLTIIGDISATEGIYAKDAGDSSLWHTTYTTVGEYSGKWGANEDDITNLANASADWDSVYTSVNDTSALWDTTYTTTNQYSGGWETAKSTVDTGNALWDTTYTTTNQYSGGWETTKSTVDTGSPLWYAAIDDITEVANTSALWDTTYTTVNEYSGFWSTTYEDVTRQIDEWNSTWSTLTANSGEWEAAYEKIITQQDEWDNTWNTLTATSANWDTAYIDSQANKADITNLANASADWGSVYTSAKGSSALWDTTYTTTNEYSGGWETTKSTVDSGNASWDAAIVDITNIAGTSADWNSVYTSARGSSALWDTTYTTTNEYSGRWETAYGLTDITTAGHVQASKTVIANSSGNVYFDDTQTLYFGDGTAFTVAGYINHNATDFRITNTTTGGNIVIWNQDTDKDVIVKLGNNDTTTKFIVRDNAVADLFTVDGQGTATISGKLVIENITIDGSNIGHTDDLDLITLADGTVTVAGAVVATGDVTGSNLNVADWDSVYTSVNDTSALWDTTYTTTNEYSGGWQSTKSTVDDGNSQWDTAYTDSQANKADITNIANTSADWDSVYTSARGSSALWDTTYTTVGEYSGKWGANEDDITNLANASADWDSVYTSVNDTSALWDTTYTTVGEYSGKWGANEDDITNLANASADWDSVYTSVNDTSALWDTTYTTTNEYSGRWETAFTKSTANEADLTNIAGVSGTYWDGTYTTVNDNSGVWDASAVVYTTLSENSGGWESVEAHVNSTSGLWDSTYTTVGGFSSYWDTVYTTVNTNSGSGVANTLTKWINNVAGDPEKIGSSIVSEAENTGVGASGSTLTIAGSTTVTGDLTIQGDFTYLNTDVRVTDQLDIKNEGTGPAIIANQTGTNDIVDFQDDGTSVFKILNDGDITVKAGATVDGRDISADGDILDAAVDDITNVANTSADWDSVYTSVNETSSLWDTTYTTTNEFSALWDTTYTTTNQYSGGWETTKSTVDTGSPLWDTTYTTTNQYSGTWQAAAATYTTVNEESGGWESTEAQMRDVSGIWDSTYTTVSSNSALWDSTYTTTNQYSGDWNAWTTTDGGHLTRASRIGISQAATEPAYTLDVGGDARFTDDVLIDGGELEIKSSTTASKLDADTIRIADPTIEINYKGAETALAGAGLFFLVQNTQKGHIRLKTGSPTGFEFKTPALNGPPAIATQTWTVNVDATKALTVAGDLNIEGDSNINQDVTTDADVTFNTVDVAAGFTSDEWDTTWNTVSSTSAFWETTYTTVNSFSSLWDAAIDDITNIAGTSADWDSAYTTAKANSGGVTTLATNSALWETTYTTTNEYSAGWETSSSRAIDNQADITNLANASADWNSAYTTAKSNSADITNVANASADWNSVYTHINSHSAVGTTHYVPTWTYNGTTEYISTTAAKLTNSIIKQTLKGDLMPSLWGASYWAGNNLTSLTKASVNDGNTASNNYAFHANGAATDGTVWLRWGNGTATLDITKLVFTHAGGDSTWTIKYSDNASDWTTVASFTQSAGAGSSTETWDSQGDHKYWAIFKTAGTNTGWVNEVQFHHLPEIALVTVEGSLSARSLSATDSTGFSYFAGKVGIGTSSPQVDLHVGGTGAIRVPAGDNAARPDDLQGMIRYNTDGNTFEGNDGSDWAAIGGVSDADQDTKILANASDADTLHFYVGVSDSPVEQLTLSDGIFQPTTHNDIDLGTSDERFKTLYLSDAVYFNTLSGHTGTFDGNLSAQDVFTTNYANVSADLSVAGVTTITTLSTQGGELDNVVIGSTTPVAGTFTTGTFNTSIVMGNVTITSAELGYIDGITLGTAAASKVMTWDVSSNWTAAGGTCADLGIVTTTDINGGTIDGVSIGASNAATEATVDNIKIDGSNIGHTSDGLNLLTLESDYLTLSGGLSARGHITGGNGTTGANLSGSVHIANGDLHVKDGNLKLSNNTNQYLLMGNGTYFQMAQVTGPVSFQWDNNQIVTSLSDIALGTNTTGLYVKQLDNDSTGVTITNNTAADDDLTPTIAVDYGHGNNTAVQGTTQLTVQGTSNEVDISYATGDTTMHMGSGGTITVGLPNDVTVTNDLNVGNDLTVTGNLTVSGDMTYMFTEVTVTSAIQVKNTGTGPAIVANQTGLQPVVDFQDDGSSVFYIQDGGNVGMGTTSPNETLTVAGNISAQGVVYGSAKISLSGGESSDNWNSVYTSVRNTSGDWDSVYTSANETSAFWDTTYTTVHSYSGLWGEGPELGALSGHASSTYLATFSAMPLSQARKWNSGVGYWSQSGLSNFDNAKINDTVYNVKSFDADSAVNNSYLQLDVGQPLHGTKMAFTKVEVWAHATGVSQTWSIQYSDDGTDFTTIDGATVAVVNGSGAGQWTYSGKHRYWRLTNKTGSSFGDGPDYYEVQFYESILVNSQTPDSSNDWNSVYTSVNETSADWDSVYTSTNETSGDWNSVYTSVNETSGDWNSVYTSTNETSALWDTTYTTVNEFSGKWAANEDDITNVANTSADWDSAYTSVNETSADWDSVYTSANETSALWDTTYTTVNEFSGKWAANEDDITNVANTSADWDSVYTSVNETSGDWNSVYSNTNAHSAVWTHPLSSYGLGEKITTSHSLTAGMACRLDVQGTYELSMAASNPRNLETDVLSAEVLGIVQWSDATYSESKWTGSNFEIVYSGICNLPNHEFGEPGVTLFLSPSTLGSVTSACPTLDYEITKPIGTIIDNNTILVQPFRGIKIIPQSSNEDNWDAVYTTVYNNSAIWGGSFAADIAANTADITNVANTSANWDTAYTKSGTNETNIAAVVADITNVANASADWNTAYTDSQLNKDDITNVANTSANWNTAYGWGNHGAAGYQSALTFGIANTNAVKINHASVADDDYAKFTASGLEGRSYTEVKSDLGLVIGTNVQAQDQGLSDIAGLATTEHNFIVGTGSNWSLKTPANARTSLGLGSIATQSDSSVAITGGAIDGTTVGTTTPAAGEFTTLKITTPAAAPATTNAAGTKGDIRYDASYIYICVATNTWKRSALVTWT